MLKDGRTLKEKASMFVLGKLEPKLFYSSTLYKATHYKLYKDLFDPKSCELPTLVESDMRNKPMEFYPLISHKITI